MRFLSAPLIGAFSFLAVLLGLHFSAGMPWATPATKTSVVEVVTDGGHGTGFYVGNNQFVTADHVISEATDGRIYVTTQSDETVTAHIVREDKARDVALLEVDTPLGDVGTANLACGEPEPAVGDKVTSIGYPLLMGLQQTFGRISSSVHEQDGNNYLYADMTIAPGNSGGPVFDTSGKVIGLSDAMPGYPTGAFGASYTLFPYDLIIPRATICGLFSTKVS